MSAASPRSGPASAQPAFLVAQTARLRLRWVEAADWPFVLELLNDPGWIRYIGDRNVHTREAAVGYIEGRMQALYLQYGFGLNVVEAVHSGEPLGLCGLIQRDTLEDADLGFAFLAAHAGRGYAWEAATAALRHARDVLGRSRVAAVVLPGNARSLRLLARLGFRFERMVQLAPAGDPLELHAVAL